MMFTILEYLKVGETKNKLKNAGCKFGNPFIFNSPNRKAVKNIALFYIHKSECDNFLIPKVNLIYLKIKGFYILMFL
jgi:hypothetical protein